MTPLWFKVFYALALVSAVVIVAFVVSVLFGIVYALRSEPKTRALPGGSGPAPRRLRSEPQGHRLVRWPGPIRGAGTQERGNARSSSGGRKGATAARSLGAGVVPHGPGFRLVHRA